MTNKGVALRDSRDRDVSRYLEAANKPKGGFIIEGQGLIPSIEKKLDFSEYEWA